MPAMPLTDHEKNALTAQLAMLLEANEPEAILMTLRRTAERMAQRILRADITELEALRWNALAGACLAVEKQLERANAPKSPQHAQQSAPEPDETPTAA